MFVDFEDPIDSEAENNPSFLLRDKEREREHRTNSLPRTFLPSFSTNHLFGDCVSHPIMSCHVDFYVTNR